MPPHKGHDAPPPAHWPEPTTFLTKPRLSPSFPAPLTPLISSSPTFAPRPVKHPTALHIKRIVEPAHPAHGQYGLFAKHKIKPNELLIPYLGIVHATLAPEDGPEPSPHPHAAAPTDAHSDSDYDLSLLRLSSADPRNPFPGSHVSIGVDAAHAGNAGRFVNDFRGIKPAGPAGPAGAGGPNAEFRVGRGEGGELRMEIWSLKGGVGKGEEVLVSYGKGWWGARTG